MKNNTAELLIRRYCSLTIHFILALLYQKEHPAIKVLFRMEHRGFEPLASTMRMLRAPSCANTPCRNYSIIKRKRKVVAVI